MKDEALQRYQENVNLYFLRDVGIFDEQAVFNRRLTKRASGKVAAAEPE